MGTNGLVGVIHQEKFKGTYNHFDSYPSGLGSEVVRFCNEITKEKGWDKFKENFSKVEFIDAETPPTPEQIEMYKKYADLNVSNKSYEDWYCLLRNVQGAECLKEIYKGKLFHIPDDSNFIKNSLFCEFAYVINLDIMKIEFYKGFQKRPQPGNRFGEELDKEEKYYPCRLVGSCSLKEIPDNWSSIFFYEGIESEDEELNDKMYEDTIESKEEFSGPAKKYILSVKQLTRKRIEIEREIEKLQEGLKTTNELISTLPKTLKEQNKHIELFNDMSNEEFEATLYKTIKEKGLL